MPAALTIAALHLLQFLATIPTLFSQDLAMPNCTPMCGNLSIPYPFGIGDEGCYRDEGFKLVCNMEQDPPMLYMNSAGYRVVHTQLKGRVLHLDTRFNRSLGKSTQDWSLNVDNRFYRVSAAQNLFIALGCGFKFSVGVPKAGDNNVSTCNSTCNPNYPNMAVDGTCSGIGCCNVTVAEDSNNYMIKFAPLNDGVPFNATWAVEKAEYWRRTGVAKQLQKYLAAPESVPEEATHTVVHWMFGNSSCAEDQKSGASWCLSDNSDCHDDPPRGYECLCQPGYKGNPYMPKGCQDIDECAQSDPPPCSFGCCINTVGSYDCVCPYGTYGNPRVKDGCAPSKLKVTGLVIAIGVGSGIFILLFVLAAVIIRRKVRARKAAKMKEFFFKQNRGLLLQQLVDTDIAERMIFSLEELEKATNSFDEARKLGGGGHGTVYKGILSDQRIVAIKKSRHAIKREIDDFINEVAILSQVNHRNVVKLFGCCLETEVPLLVYEFISNGTLHHHLHVAPPSLSWKQRMRVALEIARSLAYLHSAASVSVIHRDIKTTNILLDDQFIAKVSDFGASRGIPIDQTAVMTTIQGTFGYLDPEYYRTSRLTEKSDVYSFGVILVELLTQRRPSSYVSPEGFNLVSHFVLLVSEDRLCDILDPKVAEEAKEGEANEVAAIAVMCLNPKGEDRPSMRGVETGLEALQSSAENAGIVISNQTTEEQAVRLSHRPSVEESNGNNSACNVSRLYSMEDEFWSSMSFPR